MKDIIYDFNTSEGDTIKEKMHGFVELVIQKCRDLDADRIYMNKADPGNKSFGPASGAIITYSPSLDLMWKEGFIPSPDYHVDGGGLQGKLKIGELNIDVYHDGALELETVFVVGTKGTAFIKFANWIN